MLRHILLAIVVAGSCFVAVAGRPDTAEAAEKRAEPAIGNGTYPGARTGFDDRRVELACWNRSKNSANPEPFKACQGHYPKGSLVVLAQTAAGGLELKLGYAFEERGEYAEALHWYRPAADRGNPEAQSRIGAFYEFGLGVSLDYAEALRWYRKAAEQGELEALYRLGLMHRAGKGVPQNDAEALRWWRKAAELGMVAAMQAVAEAYEDGLGVPKDLAQARAWYQRAVDAGDEYSRAKVKALEAAGPLAQSPVPQDQQGLIGWWSRLVSRSQGSMREVVEFRPNGSYTTGICLLSQGGWCNGQATPQIQGTYSVRGDAVALQNGLILQRSLDDIARPGAPDVNLKQGRPESYGWRVGVIRDSPPARRLYLAGANEERRQFNEMNVKPGWQSR